MGGHVFPLPPCSCYLLVSQAQLLAGLVRGGADTSLADYQLSDMGQDSTTPNGAGAIQELAPPTGPATDLAGPNIFRHTNCSTSEEGGLAKIAN